MSQERLRLQQDRDRIVHWKRWGPYLSERAWGTVREDYSPDGSAWDYFPHDMARSRAYRWNEDGIAGICDRHQYICLAMAFWNGRDPILKERMFGLTGREGNHGEDVKEYWFYADNTPTHSYMKYVYKYPQERFPYEDLVHTNARRTKFEPEYELLDTGVFDDDRYFDITVEYAKQDAEDILILVTAANRGPDTATLHLLPTIWMRNVWAWHGDSPNAQFAKVAEPKDMAAIAIDHHYYGRRLLYCENGPELLFCDNETNTHRLFGKPNASRYVKDGINDYVVGGMHGAVNPEQRGTKAAAYYKLDLPPGQSKSVRLRFTAANMPEIPATAPSIFGHDFDEVLDQRKREADEFYETVIPRRISDDGKSIMRQALSGMLWSKQYYHYIVKTWLDGDPAEPPPPASRLNGRNHQWRHLYNSDVISMPDKWEYPWYAAWDLAFHCISLAIVDTDFAKEQLVLMLREWYMHPNGQLPAYEWAFGDVNPPVHAWAAWRVYKIDKKARGKGDHLFLERVFVKLMLNFTWWVNRKDAEGRNIFQGGFLGLDNIGVFDRSAPLPAGGTLEQADGTSWMGMYCLNMLAIAMELACEDQAYEDVASKFWEHFIYIAYSLNNMGSDGISIWDDEDGFYYDCLRLPDSAAIKLKVRSLVGVVPLFGVETLEPYMLDHLPSFKKRFEWFLDHRPDLVGNVASMREPGTDERRLLSLVDRDRLRRLLSLLLDEAEFLSPHGIRALSRYHKYHPYKIDVGGAEYSVDYEPAESTTTLFGGNSNWRGPIWMPMNYLIVESLQKFHYYLGDDFKVEFPARSGNMIDLWTLSQELSKRLTRIFMNDENGRRPVFGGSEKFQTDPHWHDHIPFHEYFNGDNGAGIGASHQTGWTGLVAKLIQQNGV